MRRHIDHVTVRVKDHEAAETFYRATLGALGFHRNVDVHGRVSFGTDAGHDLVSTRTVTSSSSWRMWHSLRLHERRLIGSTRRPATSVASPWTRRETGRSSVACTQRTSRP
jgi:catechol 2,3-dioxygenase-like lactoylglutathione lyase family enzyme